MAKRHQNCNPNGRARFQSGTPQESVYDQLAEGYSEVTISRRPPAAGGSATHQLDEYFHCLVSADGTVPQQQQWRLVHFVMPNWKLHPHDDHRWLDAQRIVRKWAESIASSGEEGAVLTICAPTSFPAYVSGIVQASCPDAHILDSWVAQSGAERGGLSVRHVPDLIIGLFKLSLSLLPSKRTDEEEDVLTPGFAAVGALKSAHVAGANWRPGFAFLNQRYLAALIKNGAWNMQDHVVRNLDRQMFGLMDDEETDK